MMSYGSASCCHGDDNSEGQMMMLSQPLIEPYTCNRFLNESSGMLDLLKITYLHD